MSVGKNAANIIVALFVIPILSNTDNSKAKSSQSIRSCFLRKSAIPKAEKKANRKKEEANFLLNSLAYLASPGGRSPDRKLRIENTAIRIPTTISSQIHL